MHRISPVTQDKISENSQKTGYQRYMEYLASVAAKDPRNLLASASAQMSVVETVGSPVAVETTEVLEKKNQTVQRHELLRQKCLEEERRTGLRVVMPPKYEWRRIKSYHGDAWYKASKKLGLVSMARAVRSFSSRLGEALDLNNLGLRELRAAGKSVYRWTERNLDGANLFYRAAEAVTSVGVAVGAAVSLAKKACSGFFGLFRSSPKAPKAVTASAAKDTPKAVAANSEAEMVA